MLCVIKAIICLPPTPCTHLAHGSSDAHDGHVGTLRDQRAEGAPHCTKCSLVCLWPITLHNKNRVPFTCCRGSTGSGQCGAARLVSTTSCMHSRTYAHGHVVVELLELGVGAQLGAAVHLHDSVDGLEHRNVTERELLQCFNNTACSCPFDNAPCRTATPPSAHRRRRSC